MTLNGGRFSDDGTWDGAGGTVIIENGGRLGLGGPVFGSNTFVFGAGNNIINIEAAQVVQPTIVGMAAGDTIEMSGALVGTVNQPIFNAPTGTLMYSDGKSTWTFKLTGVAAGASFRASRGPEGIDITIGAATKPAVQAPDDFTGNGTSDILFRDPGSAARSR